MNLWHVLQETQRVTCDNLDKPWCGELDFFSRKASLNLSISAVPSSTFKALRWTCWEYHVRPFELKL